MTSPSGDSSPVDSRLQNGWLFGRRAAGVQVVGLLITLVSWAVAEQMGVKEIALAVLVTLWVAWFVARGVVDPRLWSAWGLWKVRWNGGAFYAIATVVALLAIAGAGAVLGNFSDPGGLLLVAALYPPWALMQQFILQNTVVASARTLGAPERYLPFVGGLVFGAAHLPDLPLAGLTATGGIVWAWMFRRHPNLYLIALSHAAVGTAAFAWVLGRSPAEEFPALAAWL